MDRFNKLLHFLGYEEKIPSYHRGNLIHAIMDFAVLNKDSELEAACQKEIDRVRAKNLFESE